MTDFILEIAAFTLEGALSAQRAGANRIELCENPTDGGTTPSFGTLKLVRKEISIPIFPILRPRGGDFLYSQNEFEIMKQDLLLCKQLGFDGVVIGLLNADGSIDTVRTSQLVDLAYPMEVSFHRAFDRCSKPMEALQDVIATGCCRILTSGQHPVAVEGIDLIADLVALANGSIEIMPGSGVNAENIRLLAEKTGAINFHASARKAVPSPMKFENAAMNESLEYFGVNEAEVKSMLSVLKAFKPVDA